MNAFFVGGQPSARLNAMVARQMSDVRRTVMGKMVDVRCEMPIGTSDLGMRPTFFNRHARAGEITEGNDSPLPLFAISRSITQ